ncbi:MAG TPA: FAD/NAD(P)-binding protein, partial [Caulobacteraceae bacterium]
MDAEGAQHPIVVIGAGASGALLAIRLVERGATVALIERRGAFGPGLAYGTADPAHLLNVRAGRMSSRPGEPDHFTRWLGARGLDTDAEGFARRADYGAYLKDQLGEAAATGRLALIDGEATSIETGRVVLTGGRVMEAAHVVLATGNGPPTGSPADDPAVINDPWAPGALDAVRPS